jgi:hypothetical protein
MRSKPSDNALCARTGCIYSESAVKSSQQTPRTTAADAAECAQEYFYVQIIRADSAELPAYEGGLGRISDSIWMRNSALDTEP